MFDQRRLLFLLGCIPVRFLFVYLTKTNKFFQQYFWIPAAIVSFTFMYLFITGKRQTGPEAIGINNKIWWNNLRPIHAIFWGLYVINHKNPNAWMFLFIDTIFGLMSHIVFHDFLSVDK